LQTANWQMKIGIQFSGKDWASPTFTKNKLR
jgi:hypothetical protein